MPPPSSKKAAPLTPAAAPKSAIDSLCNKLNKLIVNGYEGNKVKDCGYNFYCTFPHIWWAYFYNEKQYLKADFLTFTTHPQFVGIKVTQDSKFLIVAVALQAALLPLLGWLESSVLGVLQVLLMLHNPKNKSRMPYTPMARSTWLTLQQPLTTSRFQCTQAPHDPYIPDGPGWNVGHMSDGVGGGNRTFCTINVTLQAAATSYRSTRPS